MSEELIRILEAAAPVLAVMAVVAWILFKLDRAGQHPPHSYSTENPLEVTPVKPCKCPVANCSICGEAK